MFSFCVLFGFFTTGRISRWHTDADVLLLMAVCRIPPAVPPSEDIHWASSSGLDACQMLEAGFQEQLLHFAHDRAVTSLEYGHGGALSFDFAAMEEFMLTRFFAGKDCIYLQVQEVQFVDEQVASGSSLNQNLRRKLRQDELLEEEQRRIREEISVEEARLLRRIARTSTNFVLSSGGSLLDSQAEGGERSLGLFLSFAVFFSLCLFLCSNKSRAFCAGNMLLYDYTCEVLGMGADAELLGKASLRRTVQLRHLVSLLKLLDSILVSNPMQEVDPQYKMPLPVGAFFSRFAFLLASFLSCEKALTNSLAGARCAPPELRPSPPGPSTSPVGNAHPGGRLPARRHHLWGHRHQGLPGPRHPRGPDSRAGVPRLVRPALPRPASTGPFHRHLRPPAGGQQLMNKGNKEKRVKAVIARTPPSIRLKSSNEPRWCSPAIFSRHFCALSRHFF